MKTHHENWTIKKLTENLNIIEFPEFQREPTIWRLDKKQRLIDSILRDFDISSLYFYKKRKVGFDCIDGRQRINAITAYLGLNGDDIHNNFHLRIENEIYDDKGEFDEVDGINFDNLEDPWPNKILNYKLNIVIIDDVEEDEELNLLFLRLQIASVLNAGEKLHAMTGDMHDTIFYKISKHRFFENISIPQRRYSREQVAAQITINVFTKEYDESFHRARYVDLQDFFKQFSTLNKDEEKVVKKIENNLDVIVDSFGNKLKFIKNRAVAVSTYLFCSELIETRKLNEIPKFVNFLEKLLKTLRWQIKKGVQMDEEYYDLLKFQTNISQAAGEKTAIEKRHDFIKDYFYNYLETNEIKGDNLYKNNNRDPEKERKEIKI